MEGERRNLTSRAAGLLWSENLEGKEVQALQLLERKGRQGAFAAAALCWTAEVINGVMLPSLPRPCAFVPEKRTWERDPQTTVNSKHVIVTEPFITRFQFLATSL